MPAQTVEEKAPAESVTANKQGTEATPKLEDDKTSMGTTPAEEKVTTEKETAKPASNDMAGKTPSANDAPIEKATLTEDKLMPNVDKKVGPTTDEEPAPPSSAPKSSEEVVSAVKENDVAKSEADMKTEAGADKMVIEKPADGDEGKADTTEKPEAAQIPDASTKLSSPTKTVTTDKETLAEIQDEEKSDDNPKRPKVKFGAVEKATVEEEDEEYEPNEDEDAQDDDEDEDGEIAEGDEPLLDLKSLPPSFTTSLLENGAINRPLHGLASKGKADELCTLLAKGGEMEGKVDDRDVYQYTALHVAAENDKLEVCKLLLEHGADIEASTKMHESKPIHYAAIEGHDEIISFLLEKGANIDALTDDARTALYLAAMRDHDHCVKLLLEKGANRDLADKDGKKPADVADKQAVVDLLLSPPTKKARTA